MPRRRNNHAQDMISLADMLESEEHIIEIAKITFCKDHLKNQMWDLLKTTNQKIECPVCLDEVCCKICYTVAVCGHSGHLSCLLKCKACPLCRN